MEATSDNQSNAEEDASSEPDWEARTDSDTNAGSVSDLERTDATQSVEETPKGDACAKAAVEGNKETSTSPHRLTFQKISTLD